MRRNVPLSFALQAYAYSTQRVFRTLKCFFPAYSPNYFTKPVYVYDFRMKTLYNYKCFLCLRLLSILPYLKLNIPILVWKLANVAGVFSDVTKVIMRILQKKPTATHVFCRRALALSVWGTSYKPSYFKSMVAFFGLFYIKIKAYVHNSSGKSLFLCRTKLFTLQLSLKPKSGYSRGQHFLICELSACLRKVIQPKISRTFSSTLTICFKFYIRILVYLLKYL